MLSRALGEDWFGNSFVTADVLLAFRTARNKAITEMIGRTAPAFCPAEAGTSVQMHASRSLPESGKQVVQPLIINTETLFF